MALFQYSSPISGRNDDQCLLNICTTPLVSVCIPAFNAQHTVGITLDSILAQDYVNLEVIVSDNQSTDGTKQVIERYVDRGVRYVLHAGSRPEWAEKLPSYIGCYANWTYVLSQARGEFLCLYHADDVYQSDIVRKQVALMQSNPSVGAVFTMWRTIGEDGRPIRVGSWRLPPELTGQQYFSFATLLNALLAHGNFLSAPSVMLRRTAFEAVGGFNEQQFLTSADLEMWLRIAQRFAIGIIDEPLLNYRISAKQGSAQYSQLRTTLANFYLVMDHFLAQGNVEQILEPQALAMYEMRRDEDNILCSLHLMVQGKVNEARVRLKKAVQWQNLVATRYQPRRLAWLLIGVGLLVSNWLGLGSVIGRGLYQGYQRHLRRQQSH